MKEYDLISIGTGSAMSIVEYMVRTNREMKVAVIDKDDPGGICLTRGCIPSKMLLFPAELVRTIEMARGFGIEVDVKQIRFEKVMERMKVAISEEINMIREGLSSSKEIDYYHSVAEFIRPYTLKVDDQIITSKMIFLCTGSKPTIPPIKGLDRIRYYTSDTVLKMTQLPPSLAVVGGGYIAAEYGHFFAAMGSKVTIVGRNPQFLPSEEPEISSLAKRKLGEHINILTDHEVKEVTEGKGGKSRLVAVNRKNEKVTEIVAEAILVATGRGPNTGILHPEKGGIKTDRQDWIVTNEYLKTSQPNVWAFGDANGRYPFKHAANYEATVVYSNAVLKRRVKADYHAVPHAIFTYPEIASVGLGEKEAIDRHGKDRVLMGIQRYQDTAKGEAMGVEDCFVKVIVEEGPMKILGAHIIGPQASVLIQEIINLMYTPEQSVEPIISGMHIHPALSEVVERAFRNLMTSEQYHHVVEHYFGLELTNTEPEPESPRAMSKAGTFEE